MQPWGLLLSLDSPAAFPSPWIKASGFASHPFEWFALASFFICRLRGFPQIILLCGRRQNTTGLPVDEWARRWYNPAMEYITTAYSIYYLQYHVVWVCKYRRRILNPGICGYIRKILLKLLRSMPGVKLETIGFDPIWYQNVTRLGTRLKFGFLVRYHHLSEP